LLDADLCGGEAGGFVEGGEVGAGGGPVVGDGDGGEVFEAVGEGFGGAVVLAHFAEEADAGGDGVLFGDAEGGAEAFGFEFHAEEVDFGHGAFADAVAVVLDGEVEVAEAFAEGFAVLGGAGGGPVGGGDAAGELPAEGGAFGCGALDGGLGGVGAEGAFVGGFDDLGEVEEGVGVARVDEAGAAPGAGVFGL